MQGIKTRPVFWQAGRCWHARVRTGISSWQPGTTKPFPVPWHISQPFEGSGPLPPWHLHHLGFKAEAKPGKPNLSISVPISLCAAPVTPLHRNLPPAGIAEQQQEHTRASLLCWTGLEPGANSHKWEFFYPAPLASTKTAPLQFVTIYLAAFIPLVPPVETEIGNNWLESTMEKSPSLRWDTIIYRIIAPFGEVLRLSFGPHTSSSW